MRAILLAAGRGLRLKQPYDAELPKWLAEFGGKVPHEEALRDFLPESSQLFDVADIIGSPGIKIDLPVDVERAVQEMLRQP